MVLMRQQLLNRFVARTHSLIPLEIKLIVSKCVNVILFLDVH